MEKDAVSERVTTGERLSYAAIGFAYSLIVTTIGSFILYFYTDVLLLPAAAVSLLLFVVRFFDGAIDPLIGHYMDRRKAQSGKYRDYILRWTVPFCALSFLLFLPAPFAGYGGMLAWCYAVYLLWSLSGSIIESASLPLLVTMSRAPAERRTNNTIKITGGILATLAARYLTLHLVRIFGGGSERLGFPLTMALFVAVALAALLLGAPRISERNYTAAQPFSLRKTALALLRHKPLLFLVLFFLCAQLGSSIKGQAVIYYMKYYVNRQDLTPIFLVIGVVSSLLMQPVIMWLSKRCSLTTLIVMVHGGGALSMLVMGFAGPSLPLLMCGNILYGITTAFPANLVYVYMADVSDSLSARTGGSFIAVMGSFLGLASRLGLSLAGAVIALVLYLTSYTPNAEQSGEALLGIQIAFVLLTCLFYSLAALFAHLSARAGKSQREARG